MNMIKNFLLLILFISYSQQASSLNVNAEVDRTQLASNESLRLIISVDENATENIDFTQLTHQFEIITTQRSNQTSIVNGSVSATTKWILILLPKDTGQLVIPSFKYMNGFSQAIPITVVEDNSNTQNDKVEDREIFFQASVNKNTLYVQEQVLVTLRLYYRTPLSGYDEEAFKIDNSTTTLVSELNLESSLKGIKYKVLEKIYAVHPQSSGKLIIPEQSWRLEKSLNRFNFDNLSGSPYLYVRTNPITLDVKPINEKSTADTWLPSTVVTLDKKWEQATIQAKVGEPLNYQTILIANGLTAAQLPNIVIEDTENFTIYSDQAIAEDTNTSVGIIGTRINNFAVIPKKIGSFIFPESKIKWWNTKTEAEEIAVIPEQSIIVSADDQASQNLPQIPKTTELSGTSSNDSSLLWKLAASFVSLLLIVSLFIYFKTKKTSKRSNNRLEIASSEIPSLKIQYQLIQSSIENKDWTSLKASLLTWANTINKNKVHITLNDIADHFPNLQSEMGWINTSLYAKDSGTKTTPLNQEEFIEKLKHCEKIASEKQAIKVDALKDLYKN